jgi:uncharacterized membrane protein YfcA
MRKQTTRHGRIDRQPYLNKPIGTRSIVAVYTLMLLVPVFLWAFSNPLLAAGVVALISGTYIAGRIGIRVYRRLGRRMIERLLMTTRDINQ